MTHHVAVDEDTLAELDLLMERAGYPDRASAIKAVVEERLAETDREALERACALLDPDEERTMAEEGMVRGVESRSGERIEPSA